ncbi:hypothetical protein FQA39_LY10392 [Lamprigera yunnana]|nr:hypothetical protein FQA39_LY10392 [Lamprigera yunnana]
MMDLSQDVREILKNLKVLIKETAQTNSTIGSTCLPLDMPTSNMIDELIDIDSIVFVNDENWLYESSVRNSYGSDLKQWLYQDVECLKDFDFHSNRLFLIREMAQVDSKKNIDSRTFTRPKKRLNRPSIYCEDYFKNYNVEDDQIDSNKTLTSCESDKVCDVSFAQDSQAPLNFNLNESTSQRIFENIVAFSNSEDSFQNMSPPSLINTMSSSTFTNLMENSMIKNDPLLREISVTDYTEAMLQDYDPPIFKSITDSFSSINLDNPETFIKQGSEKTLNNIYKRNISVNTDNSLNETYTAEKCENTIMNGTYLKTPSTDNSYNDVSLSFTWLHKDVMSVIMLVYIKPLLMGTIVVTPSDKNECKMNNKSEVLNGTYRKSVNSNLNETFQKTTICLSNDNLNNTTVFSKDGNKTNNFKRHSYTIDTHELNPVMNLHRNSFENSADSTDSLDYLSSLSSSSRGSNKMLNMAEVDAIVLQQEQSLHQVMSTPKSCSKIMSKLWENGISPIPIVDTEHVSDSDRSSNEEFRTVRSNVSSICPPSQSLSSALTAVTSGTDISKNVAERVNTRTLNMMSKNTGNNRIHNIKGSYSEYKTGSASLRGSYTNLRPIGATLKSTSCVPSIESKSSTSNLKTMSSKLKGSYTQLKPVLLNLPCADANTKIYDANRTMLKRTSLGGSLSQCSLKIAEVAPTLREPLLKDKIKSAPISNVNKPQIKASGLPRPTSAIPRPASSRIPAPRRIGHPRQLSRPSSKINLDYDF